ncbi:MAG: HAMP domain-containing histidine kinase [Candidatus Gracilibacteria bacterium]|nr:HAMP domain-containing histidine kinase [Candidatus Gracilibacteria bacterium]
MKILKNLTTSRRTSIIFALVNLFFMIILLIAINISYFYLWYEDQKQESLYDMNKNYAEYSSTLSGSNMEAFKSYILTKDTLIINKTGETELECSEGVAGKIHDSEMSLDKLKDSYFYKDDTDGKIYFVFTQEFEEIGTVKVLFDTTPYIKSQILIIKITLVIMLIFMCLSYYIGKVFSRYTLQDLRKISQEAKNMSLENCHRIECEGCNDDEVKILANAINQSFQKIKHQSENLKQFITDASHEFKTPLMVINSRIDLYRKLVEKGKSKPEDLEKLLDTIKGRTKKLNNILETLFILSRKTEKIEDLEKENINLSKYLPCYINEYLGNVEKNISVEYQFKGDVFQNIDKSLFNIIIDNLISNAVKFSDENSTIIIGGNQDQIWIQDYGIGMDSEVLKHVWDKFYREDTKREGFGVGLFIVSRIIQLFEWNVAIDSKKNNGSKFTITF